MNIHNEKRIDKYFELFKYYLVIIIQMDKISIKGNTNYANENKQINENEFLPLKIIDSLYKKDIVKFLEILSTNFI